MAHIFDLALLRRGCSQCLLRQLCLPAGIDAAELSRLDDIVKRRRTVQPGERLFRPGDPLQAVYVARDGAFKTISTSEEGEEQIMGFHLPGELMGLDGLASGQHASAAIALEDAEVCAIPYASLNRLAAESSDLQMLMARLMSREIVREHSLMMLLGSMNAEERLAAFLLNISQRMKVRGYSATAYDAALAPRK